MAIKDIKVLETVKEGTTIYPVAVGTEKPLATSPQDSKKTYSWHAQACDMAGVNGIAKLTAGNW